MPMRRAVLMIRQAISPRLAIRMRLNIAAILSASRSLAFAALSSKCQMRGVMRWHGRSAVGSAKPSERHAMTGMALGTSSLAMKRWVVVLVAFAAAAPASRLPAQTQEPTHNVVLFVADGLRSRMVDEASAPAMAAMAREGVYLRNGHALFPTFTTANASAMATGHMLGDTGDFSNTIYAGFQVPGAGNSLTPFLENDAVLGDVEEHFSGNYLDEATILKLARDKGYSTASIGKIGPALIFDPTERSGAQTILVDDATGTPKGIPLSAEITQRLQAAN